MCLKMRLTCSTSTPKMSHHESNIHQNDTPNRQNSSPRALLDPLGPPRAPTRDSKAPTGRPQGARNGIKDACWSPKGSQNDTEILPQLEQQMKPFLGWYVDPFWITKSNKIRGLLVTENEPHTTRDEFHSEARR